MKASQDSAESICEKSGMLSPWKGIKLISMGEIFEYWPI
jgi:hypothetical protein